MNPIIINPTAINADLACMGMTGLRRHTSNQALSCHIDRLRARILEQVARIG